MTTTIATKVSNLKAKKEKLKNEKIMPFHVAYRTKEAPSGHGYCGDFLPSF